MLKNLLLLEYLNPERDAVASSTPTSLTCFYLAQVKFLNDMFLHSTSRAS